jgi:hypothetical protein
MLQSHKQISGMLVMLSCRSRWARVLRHEPSSPARILGSWVRIPLEAWMSVRVHSVFVLSSVGSGLATGWYPVQGVLRLCIRLRNWKSGQDSKSCRAICVYIYIYRERERERERVMLRYQTLACSRRLCGLNYATYTRLVIDSTCKTRRRTGDTYVMHSIRILFESCQRPRLTWLKYFLIS